MIVFANVLALEMTLGEQHESRIPHLSNEQVESIVTHSYRLELNRGTSLHR